MGRTSHCEREIEREKVREKSESEIGKKRATDDPEGPPMAEPITRWLAERISRLRGLLGGILAHQSRG